jgi:hypothetical protein
LAFIDVAERGGWPVLSVFEAKPALGEISRFLVVDRGGSGEDCQELALDVVVLVTA